MPPHLVQRRRASGRTAGRAAAFAAAAGRPPRRWSHRPAVEIRPGPSGPRSGRPAAPAAACAQAPSSPRGQSRRPSRSSSCSVGPQRGQAIGWAWNRRSAGLSYSARQSGHIAKRGHRGPRPVVGQLLDDRPPRPAVRAIGERIAVAPLAADRGSRPGTRRTWPDRPESSAAARTRPRWCGSRTSLRRRRKQAASRTSIASMRACGGWPLRSASRKASTAAGSPCTSIRTVSASLRTQPLRPSARAAL